MMMPIYASVERGGGIVRFPRSLGFWRGLLQLDFLILIRDIWDFLLRTAKYPGGSTMRTGMA